MKMNHSGAMELPVTSTTKGTDLLQLLLASQYRGHPILMSDLNCVFAEMDELFVDTDQVYYGRMLDWAIGAQLDAIGRILGQTRNFTVPVILFGFDGAANSGTFGDLNDEALGAPFDDLNTAGETIVLDDAAYRRLLRARAFISGRQAMNSNEIMMACSIANGRCMRATVVNTSTNVLTITFDALTVESGTAEFLQHLAQLMIGTGKQIDFFYV